jgi:hypothetical protein
MIRLYHSEKTGASVCSKRGGKWFKRGDSGFGGGGKGGTFFAGEVQRGTISTELRAFHLLFAR